MLGKRGEQKLSENSGEHVAPGGSSTRLTKPQEEQLEARLSPVIDR